MCVTSGSTSPGALARRSRLHLSHRRPRAHCQKRQHVLSIPGMLTILRATLISASLSLAFRFSLQLHLLSQTFTYTLLILCRSTGWAVKTGPFFEVCNSCISRCRKVTINQNVQYFIWSKIAVLNFITINGLCTSPVKQYYTENNDSPFMCNRSGFIHISKCSVLYWQ